MAFTPRTETYVNLSSLTTPFDITVTKPTGTADGDMLFCLISWYGSGVTIDSAPSGWALLASYTAATDKYAVYWKLAASEGSTWTWSFSATAKVRAVCSCYTSGDFDPADPIDVVSNTSYRTLDSNVIAAAMTVSETDSPLVFWGNVYSTVVRTYDKPTTPTTDWVEDEDSGDTTPDFSNEICSMIWAGSGSTTAMTAVVSATIQLKHAFAVALTPGAPPTGPSGVKTINDLAIAGVKTLNDTPIASVKTVNG